MEAQQAVQGLCIHDAGGLRHAPAGFACGGSQLDDLSGIERPVGFDHRLENGALAGARASGDDGQVVAKDHLHTIALFLG